MTINLEKADALAEQIFTQYVKENPLKAMPFGEMRDLVRNEIQSAYEQGKADVVPQWMPIETAPRDGRRILLWTEDYKGRAYIDCVLPDGQTNTYSCAPTHWMPLPAKPQQEVKP